MISASNLTPGDEGFLMDLEFAKIDELMRVVSVEGSFKRTTWSTQNRGVQMTEILESIIKNKPIAHEEHHDLESFAWVVPYVVFQRLLRDVKLSQSERSAVRKQYEQSFGGLKLDTVLLQRKSLSAFDIGQDCPAGTVPAAIVEFAIGLSI
ncbi:hypothetical protein HGRIS_001153 [Hohenbuehelia grisea]|uniref:Uncharacterized protein n=1 Tax=Hohenbuehelia grisea TaxID=104357 RepID=A0ABR3JNG0_9AGAR